LALSKAISRQHRGGGDFAPFASGGNFRAARSAHDVAALKQSTRHVS
jgi:hypothetical protein